MMASSKMLEVTLLDETTMQFEITRKTFGRDVLEQICHTNGIWEPDYFSLQHSNSRGEPRWLNLRNPLLPQLMEESMSRDNFSCNFRVKFFTPPQQLVMSHTKHLFYLDLKKKLEDGSLKIFSYMHKIKVFSCLAQAEIGDIQLDPDIEDLYKGCIPGYKGSMFEELKRRHAILRLTTKSEAENLFLSKLSQIAEYGIEKYTVYSHGREIMSLQIYLDNTAISLEGQPDRCIPFKDIISARVNRNMLHLVIENFPEKNLLLSPDQSEITAASSPSEEQTLSEVTLQFISTEQCWHVYRALTERIVFYSRQRATDIETPHFKCRWHSFVAKVQPSKAHELRIYDFDVERTSRETYENAWNILATDTRLNGRNERVTCGIPHTSCIPCGFLGNRRGRRNEQRNLIQSH